MATNTQIKQENLSMLVNTLGIDLMPAMQLQKLAKSLHRSHENECNYGLTPRQETRERNIMVQIESIAGHFDLYVAEQGDPRGWPIIISPEPVREDGRGPEQRVCPF